MDCVRETEEHTRANFEFESKRDYFAEREFRIDNSIEITEKLLTDLCPSLRSLIISKENISDCELGMILYHSINLELLIIRGWSKITFEGLTTLQAEHLKLKYLEIYECPYITEKGMDLIIEKFPNITDFDLDMSEISQNQVKALVNRCSNLVALHIEHSDILREEGLEVLFNYLSEKYPPLAIWFH